MSCGLGVTGLARVLSAEVGVGKPDKQHMIARLTETLYSKDSQDRDEAKKKLLDIAKESTAERSQVIKALERIS